MSDVKPKRVRFGMKYVGWNLGSVRTEKETYKADIEILELTIDGVDILKILDDYQSSASSENQSYNRKTEVRPSTQTAIEEVE